MEYFGILFLHQNILWLAYILGVPVWGASNEYTKTYVIIKL